MAAGKTDLSKTYGLKCPNNKGLNKLQKPWMKILLVVDVDYIFLATSLKTSYCVRHLLLYHQSRQIIKICALFATTVLAFMQKNLTRLLSLFMGCYSFFIWQFAPLLMAYHACSSIHPIVVRPNSDHSLPTKTFGRHSQFIERLPAYTSVQSGCSSASTAPSSFSSFFSNTFSYKWSA